LSDPYVRPFDKCAGLIYQIGLNHKLKISIGDVNDGR